MADGQWKPPRWSRSPLTRRISQGTTFPMSQTDAPRQTGATSTLAVPWVCRGACNDVASIASVVRHAGATICPLICMVFLHTSTYCVLSKPEAARAGQGCRIGLLLSLGNYLSTRIRATTRLRDPAQTSSSLALLGLRKNSFRHGPERAGRPVFLSSVFTEGEGGNEGSLGCREWNLQSSSRNGRDAA